ncbi:MAG: hypothetical protein ABI807_10445, partial [Sporichthyaceae bacterium]
FVVAVGLAVGDGARLSASRLPAAGVLVEAAALGWPGSSPRQTASEVISDATARTARKDGSTAEARPCPVRWAPCRRRWGGVGDELMTAADAGATARRR